MTEEQRISLSIDHAVNGICRNLGLAQRITSEEVEEL